MVILASTTAAYVLTDLKVATVQTSIQGVQAQCIRIEHTHKEELSRANNAANTHPEVAPPCCIPHTPGQARSGQEIDMHGFKPCLRGMAHTSGSANTGQGKPTLE
jgi:hypothetical protein